jgi:hypothetical protein
VSFIITRPTTSSNPHRPDQKIEPDDAMDLHDRARCLSVLSHLKSLPLASYAKAHLTRYHCLLLTAPTLDVIEAKIRSYGYPSVSDFSKDVTAYYTELAVGLSSDSPAGLVCLTLLAYFTEEMAKGEPPTTRASPDEDVCALFDEALSLVPNSAAEVQESMPGEKLTRIRESQVDSVPVRNSPEMIARVRQGLNELKRDRDLEQLARIVRTYNPQVAKGPGALTLDLEKCSPGLICILDNFVTSCRERRQRSEATAFGT